MGALLGPWGPCNTASPRPYLPTATCRRELDLLQADRRLQRLSTSRLDLLLAAASYGENLPQVCANGQGQCGVLYETILNHQKVDSAVFRHWVYEALDKGRQKGNALMLVGGSDTGKTTVTQPAAMIFRTMECPQADSFCPLESIRGHELILWHDFRFSPGHPKKSEQGMRLDEGTFNRLLEGLPTRIGVPKSDGSRRDFVYEESAAFIFTGPFALTAWKDGKPDAVETEQIARRIKYVHFSEPAPQRGGIVRGKKDCTVCWARWVLEGELAWRTKSGNELDAFLAGVAAVCSQAVAGPPLAQSNSASSSGAGPAGAVPPANVVDQLRELISWKEQGFVTAAEFECAKRALGLR